MRSSTRQVADQGIDLPAECVPSETLSRGAGTVTLLAPKLTHQQCQQVQPDPESVTTYIYIRIYIYIYVFFMSSAGHKRARESKCLQSQRLRPCHHLSVRLTLHGKINPRALCSCDLGRHASTQQAAKLDKHFLGALPEELISEWPLAFLPKHVRMLLCATICMGECA